MGSAGAPWYRWLTGAGYFVIQLPALPARGGAGPGRQADHARARRDHCDEPERQGRGGQDADAQASPTTSEITPA